MARGIETQLTQHTVLAKGRPAPYCVVAHAMLAQIGNMLKGEASESALCNVGGPYAHVALPSLSLMKGLGLKCERYEKPKSRIKKKKEIEI